MTPVLGPGGRWCPCHSADEPWHFAPTLSERAGQVKPAPRGGERAPSTGALSTDLRGRPGSRPRLQCHVRQGRLLGSRRSTLLLDEPLSNLDANLREAMRFEIRRLLKTFAITTLYVTHDQAEAMVISDRVAVLQDGRVVQLGTAEELFERPRTRFVAEFIGKTNLIDGVADGTGTGARGRLRLRVASTDLTPGAPVGACVPLPSGGG